MGSMEICEHLESLSVVEPVTPDGCQECLESGDSWLHLRLCMGCGHVGCCDSSPNRHATRHSSDTGHGIVQSFELHEDWAFCYPDESYLLHVDPSVRRPNL